MAQIDSEVSWVLWECLKTNLQIIHKCLIYEQTSVALNEGGDDPYSTNVKTCFLVMIDLQIPSSWKQFFENSEMVDVLFFIIKSTFPESEHVAHIKKLATLALGEIANIR